MGSKSSSKESTKSTAFNFNNVDYAGGGGPGLKNLNLGLVDSNLDSLEITDGGAVQAMLQATLGNQDLAKGFINGSKDLAVQVTKGNQDFLKNINADQHDLYSSLASNLTSYADKQATQAQNATSQALKYVYDASQGETAAVTENLSKWMIGAAVAVALLGFLAMMAMRGND